MTSTTLSPPADGTDGRSPGLTAATSPFDRTLGTRPPWAWGAVVAVVVAKSALNMAVAGRYGWHIDELYYRLAGQHPMLGYTDFPPLVPMVARLAATLFGSSLPGLRAFAVLAGAGAIVASAAIARELGGRRWAQGVAALAAASPTLGSNAMFQTVSFDQLTWALVLLAALRVLRVGSRRTWVELGGAIALASLTKYTVAVLVLALVVGFAATRSGRERLRTGSVGLAAVVAIVPVLPNLWWQARHGWPSVAFFTGRSGTVRDEYPPQKFVAEFLIVAGPPALALWLAGARSLLQDRRLRAVGIAMAAVPLAFLLLGGKGYYAVPVVFVAYGAGAVAGQDRISRFWRRGLPVALIAGPLAFSPFILPVLPRHAMVRAGLADLRSDYGAEIGWPELVDATSTAWHGLPPAERRRTVLLAASYGEAGAFDLWGPAHHLPPAVSGHVSLRYWAPRPATMAATAVLSVGYDRRWLAPRCATLRRVGRIPAVPGMQYDAGEPIWWCDLHGTVADLWPALAHG